MPTNDLSLETSGNRELSASPDTATDAKAGLDADAQLKAEARLTELTNDFQRLKRQKARKYGGVEGRVLLNVCFVNGEQYVNYKNTTLSADPRDENKLQLVFNLIGPRVGKLIGRISAMGAVYKANADKTDPEASNEAEVVDRLISALDQKLDQPSRTWEILWWMMVGGVAFEHVPWIPNATVELGPAKSESGELLYTNTATGEELPESLVQLQVERGLAPQEMFELKEEPQLEGEVGSEVFGPLNVFLDQGVKSIKDLSPDQRVYIARIRTTGWIKDTFGVEIEAQQQMSIVTSKFNQLEGSTGGMFLRDLIPLIQGTNDETDPGVAVVVEAYTPPSSTQPEGWFDVFVPGVTLLHSDVNPYGEIPIVDYHWKPVTTTFWTKDYISDLIPAQKFINKRMSQLGEQSNATLYSQLLLGAGLTAADIPADYPGVVANGIDEGGNPRVRRMEAPELPAWFLQSLDMTMRTFNDLAGGADLFQENRFPGQIRGPMAVPMLQEILDTEWGPLFQHLGERTALVKQMRINRVKQFYPPQRTLHYTSRTQKEEVLSFHTEKVLRSGTNYNVTVDRGSLIPELRALREARVMERLNSPLSILYIDERTGKWDKSKIAADLAMGDAARESRESQYRKLGMEIVAMLWKGQQPPPVLPFYDHAVMMDEMEAAMATTEYLHSSPQIQQLFARRWEEHRQYLIQEAQAQQQAMAAQASNNAVAQATQQAAAQAAAKAVDAAFGEAQVAKAQPTGQLVQSAAQAEGLRVPGRTPRPFGGTQ